jgi:hypothetical protein
MSTQILRQIRQAVEQLNPNEVRESAEQLIWVRLNATSEETYRAIERVFCPPGVSRGKQLEIQKALYRRGEAGVPDEPHVDIYELGMNVPKGGFVFDPAHPPQLIADILRQLDDIGLALARSFPPFHKPVTDKIIFNVSKENATFALATALPDIMPGVALPWAVPEMVSDASVLTVNQIRMAFLLAAASDRPVGYREQKAEIGSIIAGCFGWRALARQLISKVPMGGGIIPKAGIAFAATYVEGMSLERFYRVGYGFSRGERKLAYGEALAKGKDVAMAVMDALRPSRR